jgi:hypothetical protein
LRRVSASIPSAASCTVCRTDLPFEQAAIVEPVSIAVHAVQRAKITPGAAAGGDWQRDDRPARDAQALALGRSGANRRGRSAR